MRRPLSRFVSGIVSIVVYVSPPVTGKPSRLEEKEEEAYPMVLVTDLPPGVVCKAESAGELSTSHGRESGCTAGFS